MPLLHIGDTHIGDLLGLPLDAVVERLDARTGKKVAIKIGKPVAAFAIAPGTHPEPVAIAEVRVTCLMPGTSVRSELAADGRERSFYVEDLWGNVICFVEAGTEFTGQLG